MEKLRDFFYNKNDIVVAILILIIAATLIFFRISAIMDYPSAMAASQKSVTPAEPADKEVKDNANSKGNE